MRLRAAPPHVPWRVSPAPGREVRTETQSWAERAGVRRAGRRGPCAPRSRFFTRVQAAPLLRARPGRVGSWVPSPPPSPPRGPGGAGGVFWFQIPTTSRPRARRRAEGQVGEKQVLGHLPACVAGGSLYAGRRSPPSGSFGSRVTLTAGVPGLPGPARPLLGRLVCVSSPLQGCVRDVGSGPGSRLCPSVLFVESPS